MKVIATKVFLFISGILFLSGCVAKRKYLDEQIANRYLRSDSAVLANKVNELQNVVMDLQKQIDQLKNDNATLSNSIQDKTNALNQNQQALAEQQKKLAQLQAYWTNKK